MACTVIVLVGGGAASRMLPLSYARSKAVIPFLGRPLLHYLLRSLQRQGFTNIVLTSPGVNEDVRRCFGDGSKYGVTMRYGESASRPGTVNAVRAAIGSSNAALAKTILIIYGDSLLDVDFCAFVAGHEVSGAPVTLLAHRARFDAFPLITTGSTATPTRTNYGVVDVRDDWSVSRFEEKATFDTIVREFARPVASAAVYAFEREFLLRALAESTESADFGYDCFPAWVAAGTPVRAADIGAGFRIDIGTLPQYLTAQLAALRGQIAVEPDFPLLAAQVWADPEAVVPLSHAHVERAVVCADARIEEGATVVCSVVGAGATVDDSAVIEESVLLENVHIGPGSRIVRSILGANTSVEAGAQLPPNSVLGDYSRVGAHLVLDATEFQHLVRG